MTTAARGRSCAITVQCFDVTVDLSPSAPSSAAAGLARAHSARFKKSVVFIATLGDVVQGHSLITTVVKNSALWLGVGDGAVVAALANARLVEIHGLEVSPTQRSRGVATALLRAQLIWLAEHPSLLAVAEVWRGDPSIDHIAGQLGIWLGQSPDEHVDHYKYDAEIARAYLNEHTQSF